MTHDQDDALARLRAAVAASTNRSGPAPTSAADPRKPRLNANRTRPAQGGGDRG